MSGDDSLPALFLLPGIGGYEGSWAEMADACDTLEALIAAGRCKPTLLVMPDCGRWPVTGRPSYHNRTVWLCMLLALSSQTAAYKPIDKLDELSCKVSLDTLISWPIYSCRGHKYLFWFAIPSGIYT